MTRKENNLALEVKDLGMQYGDNQVLKSVNFHAAQGEVLVLLGPNGAGKTTTIEILEGFRRASTGTATVLGVNPEKGDEAWRSKLGIVLQSWRDHSKWHVRELLHHIGKYYAPYSTSSHFRPNDTDKVLDIVGLADHAHKTVGALSGGQRRRLDVAIGLIGNPEVLFLDEPTVGFDPIARQEFHDVIHRLSDLEKTTILLTTHDLQEAEKLADRIIVLAGGKIIANGTVEELAQKIQGRSEVRWRQNGKQMIHSTKDATAFVRELLNQHASGIFDLQIHGTTLEETYMELIKNYEQKKEIEQ
ncbi:MAG TPA: ABC transporter ATP-binding protein [Patescibacteria group bacterium]|nr:ABC transporter ATP-binding protein [Patescibacteria group bacterium]